MSAKSFSRAQQNWFRGAFKQVVIHIRREIKNPPKHKYWKALTEEELLAQQWRLGLNLYKSYQYFEAMSILEVVCANGPDGFKKRESGEESLNKDSNVHLCAARCCVQMFLETKLHYHLENAYRHYQNSVETLKVDLYTMFRLPAILLEFGRMLEYYGAFEAALDLYTRILTQFPNFRGYFDAMYRSAVVGRHIADLTTDQKHKEELLNKCIDILQFILEAVPHTINDTHAVLLYARTLESSTNPAVRFRAGGVYQSMFQHLKAEERGNTARYSTFKDWMEDPLSWIMLGEEIGAQHEPLIAKDGFENFVQKSQRGKTGKDKELHVVVDFKTCMKLAKNFAMFQNYEMAAKYAEAAFKQDHFDKEARACLSKWSKVFERSLKKEENAIGALVVNWKSRCWSNGFRKKLRNNIVQEMESKLKINRLNKEARENLAYYARDKWRSKFMFEEECAKRVQRLFRMKKQLCAWQSSRRQAMLNKTVEVYQQYQRRPLDKTVRDLVREITDHRLCPKKHIINRVRKVIDEQDSAAAVMRRSYLAFRNRMGVIRCIRRRRLQLYAANVKSALKVQTAVRRKLAYLELRQRIRRRKLNSKAVVVVQRFVRWRNRTFQHAVTRIVCRLQDRRDRAETTLRTVFLQYLKRALYFRRVTRKELQAKRLTEDTQRRRDEHLARIGGAARLLQRMFSRNRDTTMFGIALRSLRARRSCENSVRVASTLALLAIDSEFLYRSPGVKQGSPLFNALIAQRSILCDKRFTHLDGIMLGSALPHRQCRTERLVLQDVPDGGNPSFQFDLTAGIGKCKSLRSLLVLGGCYSEPFLAELFNQVQVENPGIQELAIENPVSCVTRTTGALSDCLSFCAGKLLCDFFNYSLPGLQTLSLHGCGLKDRHLDALLMGLQVNAALKTLVLSRNLITDDGFISVFQAVSSNKKGGLASLDFGWNLIVCRQEMRRCINSYISKSHECLQVSLIHNLILRPFEAEPSHRRRIEVKVLCSSGPAVPRRALATHAPATRLSPLHATTTTRSPLHASPALTQPLSPLRSPQKLAPIVRFSASAGHGLRPGKQAGAVYD